MEWEDEDTLCRQLADADASLYFLILLILSVCLSWAATAIQRQGLYRVLKGEIQKLPDVFSLRLAANALVVGALTFFFGLVLLSLDLVQYDFRVFYRGLPCGARGFQFCSVCSDIRIGRDIRLRHHFL